MQAVMTEIYSADPVKRIVNLANASNSDLLQLRARVRELEKRAADQERFIEILKAQVALLGTRRGFVTYETVEGEG